MHDLHATRCEPRRDSETSLAGAPEITRAADDQCAVVDVNRQRHADAGADAFLEPGWAVEALHRANDLWQPAGLMIETRPALRLGLEILGDEHRGWGMRKGPERKRCAERARKLRTQPAEYAQPGGGDLADEHRGFVRGEHAFEAFLHG